MGDHQPGEKVAEGRQSIDVVNDIARKDDDVRLSSIHCLEGQKFAVADISEMEVSQDSEPIARFTLRSKARAIGAARAGSSSQVSATSAPISALAMASSTPEEKTGSMKA